MALCRLAMTRAGCPGRSASSIATLVYPEPDQRGFADHLESSVNISWIMGSQEPASRSPQDLNPASAKSFCDSRHSASSTSLLVKWL